MKSINIHIIYSALALSSGLLLSAAWPAGGFFFLLFIALVPLLILENHLSHNITIKRKGLGVFLYSYLTFFTWNLLTTWWIVNATFFGAVMAFIFNSLFMTLVFLLFHHTKMILGMKKGFVALIVYWISFEYLHHQWDLTWPWLTFGNGFAASIKVVQWYEYTGVYGGTLWVWLSNMLVFYAVKKPGDRYVDENGAIVSYPVLYRIGRAVAALTVIFFPIIISHFIYSSYSESSDPVDVVVVQPNIDPYTEKFNELPAEIQISKILRLANTLVDSNTRFVVAPETAIPDAVWDHDLPENASVKLLWNTMQQHPQLNLIIGLSYIKSYMTDGPPTTTARKFKLSEGYYDMFNAAMFIDNNGAIQLYNKSKLVPGVEKMPYPAIFGFLEDFSIDLGGASGSLGSQDERAVFYTSASEAIAPSICYESIYGEFMSEYVANGAEAIFIITNDGWWADTPGYRQHMHYARLRAVENRRSIARSANTGISCFINQRGDITQKTSWWVEDVLKETINLNKELTFYTRHGDYIARISIFLSVIMILYFLVRRYTIK
ncbi:MAG: apolipoprotein N-acyltransferase [Bacteroidia bacterium]